MKYRVTLMLDFDKKADAETLAKVAFDMVSKASNTNEGLENQEIGFVDFRECNHDDLTRTKLDKLIGRVEVSKVG